MQNLKPIEKLPGDIGKFLGNLERYKLAMTLEGDQGAGKTQLAFQLANAFADVGYTVAYYAIELGKDSELIQRHKNKYIAPKNYARVFVGDNNLLSTIKNYAEAFDVVIIDSFTKLKYDDGGEIYSKELDALRSEYPRTIWIPLFQRNSKNTIRGGPGPLFDASINIEVHKVDDTFVNNYAVCSKNRYTPDVHKLNISTGKIIPPPKSEEAVKKK